MNDTDSPISSASGQASHVKKILGEALGVAFSSKFDYRFYRHAMRVGPSNVEDLGSLLVVECLENFGNHTDEQWIIQALERVVKRLTRESLREVPLTFSPIAQHSAEPEQTESLIPHELRSVILSKLSTDQVKFLDLYLSVGENIDRVERMKRTVLSLGMSQSKGYQMLQLIKSAINPALRHTK